MSYRTTSTMKRLGIYHSVDCDGFACAAILRHRYPDIDLFGMNYGDAEPHFIEDYDQVYITDFSLPPARLQELATITDLHWIDHHRTAMAACAELNIPGLQRIGEGACSLLWKYLYPHIPVPEVIRLLSDYDVWKISPVVLQFQYGLRLCDSLRLPDEATSLDDTKEGYAYRKAAYLWTQLIRGSENLIARIKKEGSIVHRYITGQLARAIRRGVALQFHGHSALFIMTEANPSLLPDAWEEYDICIKAFYDLSISKWRHTLYTRPGGPDVGEIAKMYGGGGHLQCAGFQWDHLVLQSRLG